MFSGLIWLAITAVSQSGPGDQAPRPASARFEIPDASQPAQVSQSATAPTLAAPASNVTGPDRSAAGRGVSALSGVSPTVPAMALQAVTPATASPAVALLEQALARPERGGLEGQPRTLRQAIERHSGSQERLRVVVAYWRLSQTLASYHFAAAEAAFVADLPVPQARHDQALLTAAQAAAKACWSEARLAAVQAQQDLVDAGGGAPDQSLPWPSDAPFVGAYRTQFEQLRSRGAVPDQLRRVYRTLPVLREVLDAQAGAALTGASALTELQRAYAPGQVDVNTILDAHRRLVQQRRDFLGSVQRYNETIANYALAVATPGLDLDRLVGMLIAVPPTDQSVLAARRSSAGIRRASGEEGWTVPAASGSRGR